MYIYINIIICHYIYISLIPLHDANILPNATPNSSKCHAEQLIHLINKPGWFLPVSDKGSERTREHMCMCILPCVYSCKYMYKQKYIYI